MSHASPLTARFNRVVSIVEQAVVFAMIVLLVLVLAVAVWELWRLFFERAGDRLGNVANAADFQDILQNAFGGILVVFVGLELLETMRAYFADHHVRVEVIIFVAMIATGRHIIGLDPHHTEPAVLIGLATLMLALSGSYFLLKKTGKASS